MRLLLNPAFLFLLIWGGLGLYSLRLSEVLEPLTGETIYLVLSCILAFCLSFFIYKVLVPKSVFFPCFDLSRNSRQLFLKSTGYKVKMIGLSWFFLSLVELYWAGNFPLFSLLGFGSYINYVDFGIGGLHGFLNAIYLFLICYLFLRARASNMKIYWILLVALLLWPVLLTTRQLILSSFLQILFIYIFTARINVKVVFFVLLSSAFALLIFGYLGDIRSGREHIIEISKPVFEYPDTLPSVFIWVYMYIVTPLNNINHNIVDVEPLYFPFNSIISLLPSFLREHVFLLIGQSDEMNLVSESFNVSSFFKPFLLDFGYIMISFVMFFIASIFMIIMHLSSSKIMHVIIMSIFLHSIVLSVFANFITHVVFVFEMLLVVFVFKIKLKRVNI